MEASSDQRINELCKQVIETSTPLDQIQMLETGDEREKLIVAIRAKVIRLFDIDTPTNFKNMMGALMKARAHDIQDSMKGIRLCPRVTKLPDVPAPRLPGRRY